MTQIMLGIDPIDIATWRKSTRSADQGGNCVEAGAWRKSSRSNGTGGQACVEAGAWRKSTRSGGGGNDDNCVEAGTCTCHGIAVRDSKHLATPPLTLTRADWTALLSTAKAAAH